MQVASALASVEVAEFQPKQGYTIPTESTDGESKPAAAATDDHEVIKTLADKLKVCPLSNQQHRSKHQDSCKLPPCL